MNLSLKNHILHYGWFFFVFFCLSGYANDDDLALSTKLKQEYPDESWIALRYKSAYTFVMNKKGGEPFIESQDAIESIALKSSSVSSLFWFYDDNSFIESEKIVNRRGKGIDFKKVCGNYENNDVFYSDTKVCLYKIPFQNQGEVALLNVKQVHTDTRYFSKVFFIEPFPVEEREISFSIPSAMEVELVEVNFEGYTIVKNKQVNPKTQNVEYKYIIHKLPKADNEENTLGPAHTYPHLLILTKAYKTEDGIRHTIIGSVEDLYNWYSLLAEKTKNDPSTLKPLVQKLISSAKTDTEKVKNIFYWVQDNIRYIAFEDGIAGFKPEEAQSVYEKKYGDCKGMANLTKSMLKVAGFDARLTWIGTTRLPYSFKTPCLGINNHMICTVFIEGKQYYLDPTEKFVAFGEYAERIQNKEVLIENDKKFMLETVPVMGVEKNLIELKEGWTIEKDKLKGNSRMTVKGEAKTELLRLYDRLRNDKKDEAMYYILSQGDKNTDVANIKTSDFKNREADLQFEYEATITNHVNVFGNDIYIDADLRKEFGKNIIEDKRKNDYSFDRKIFQKNYLTIALPEGYKVKHLPENLDLTYPDFSVSVHFKTISNQVVCEKIIKVNQGIIRKKDFKTWNEAIQKLNKIYEDQIILTR